MQGELQNLFSDPSNQAQKDILSNSTQKKIPSCTLKIIKAGAFVLGASAGVSYVSPASRLAGEYTGLAYIFAGSTVIVFGITSSWGWYQTMKEVFDGYYGKETLSKAALSKIPISFVLAGGSACVTYYTVNHYNNSIVYPILSVINNFGLDWSGYFKLLGNFSSKKNDPNKIIILNENACYFQALKKIILLVPLINFSLNAYLSYQSANSIIPNLIIGILFVMLTAIPAMGLDIFASQDLVVNVFGKTTQRDIQPNSQKGCLIVVKCFALLLAISASSSRGFIALDTFGKNILGYILFPLLIATGAVFSQFVLKDVINVAADSIFCKKTINRLLLFKNENHTNQIQNDVQGALCLI